MFGKGKLQLMKCLCIKTQGQYETIEVVDQLDREIQIAAAGCHCGLNKMMIYFTNENEERLWKVLWPVLHQIRKFMVLAVLTYSSRRHNWHCVYR
jgi:hypothetical protein